MCVGNKQIKRHYFCYNNISLLSQTLLLQYKAYVNMLTGQVGLVLCPLRCLAKEALKVTFNTFSHIFIFKKKKKKCLHVLTVHSITLSVANANNVHVFGCEVLGAVGEVAHHGEQPP